MKADSPVFRALADPTRRQILDMLREGGALRVGEIASRFGTMSRIAVAKHLRILAEANLIETASSEDRREHRYALNPDGLSDLAEWLRPYETFWRARLAALKHIVESDEPPKGG